MMSKVKSRSHHDVAHPHTPFPMILPSIKVSTSYTLQFPRYGLGKILKVKVTTARPKVTSRSHHDVAHLHFLTNVPTKYQLATPYSFCDTSRTNFFPLSTHLDTMGENNTPTALKGCGVTTIPQQNEHQSTV